MVRPVLLSLTMTWTLLDFQLVSSTPVQNSLTTKSCERGPEPRRGYIVPVGPMVCTVGKIGDNKEG